METEDTSQRHHSTQAESTLADRGNPMSNRTREAGQPAFYGRELATYEAQHFKYKVKESVACITLDRPERKNALTFDSYGELRDLFRSMSQAADVRAVVLTGAGENFCS